MLEPSARQPSPQVWDDGTLAAPLAALKDEAGERSPGGEGRPFMDRADAADPDFTPQVRSLAFDLAQLQSMRRPRI